MHRHIEKGGEGKALGERGAPQNAAGCIFTVPCPVQSAEHPKENLLLCSAPSHAVFTMVSE